MLKQGGCSRAEATCGAAGTRTRLLTIRLLALIAPIWASMLTGCSNVVEWREEVKLNDGRTIVVTQKRRCEGGDYRATRNATCVAREAWLTVKLPEFSSKDIVWHESLSPMVLNVDKGVLYVIGFSPHPLEFEAYGATNPPYFGFVWNGVNWKRIAFPEIPVSIYDGNMLIESIPKNRTGFLRLAMKNSDQENGDSRYPHYLRRVEPAFAKWAL